MIQSVKLSMMCHTLLGHYDVSLLDIMCHNWGMSLCVTIGVCHYFDIMTCHYWGIDHVHCSEGIPSAMHCGYCVLVKMLLCRHYPMLNGLSFLDVNHSHKPTLTWMLSSFTVRAGDRRVTSQVDFNESLAVK